MRGVSRCRLFPAARVQQAEDPRCSHTPDRLCVAVGSTSGQGVTDCYADRALSDARGSCNELVMKLRNKYDIAKLCSGCEGSGGKSVFLIGQVGNSFDAGTCGIFGCSGRSCSYSARYGCCVDARNYPQEAQPSSRGDDGLKLTGDSCGCTQTNRNPVTGASISCTCYFDNQVVANQCSGARYGQSSKMWYRDC